MLAKHLYHESLHITNLPLSLYHISRKQKNEILASSLLEISFSNLSTYTLLLNTEKIFKSLLFLSRRNEGYFNYFLFQIVFNFV